jgi:hypothetical protein
MFGYGFNTWVVVIRKTRGEETKKGRILYRGLSEKYAKETASKLNLSERYKDFNVWAMDRTDY